MAFRVIALLIGLSGCALQAVTINTITAADDGAGPGSLHPNSSIAAASFFSSLSPATLIDFEGAPVGNFSSLALGGGVSLSLTNTVSDSNGGIAGVDEHSPYALGFNITAGGSKHLRIVPDFDSAGASATFSFASPIDAFGLFLTDTQTTLDGPISLAFNDGSAETAVILKTGPNGGVVFYGVEDPGHSFSSITVKIGATGSSRDIFGIDNVMYGTMAPVEADAVPEPSAMVLTVGGLAVLLLWRARRAALLLAIAARLGFGAFTAVNSPNGDYVGSVISIPVPGPAGATINSLSIPEMKLTVSPAATVTKVSGQNALDSGTKTTVTFSFSSDARLFGLMVSHGLTTPLSITATFYDGAAVVGSTSAMVPAGGESFLGGSTSDQKFTSVAISATSGFKMRSPAFGAVAVGEVVPPARRNLGALGKFNWQASFMISDNDGMVVSDVALNGRSMLKKNSIPYYNIATSATRGPLRCELRPDYPFLPCRTRLIYFDSVNKGSATDPLLVKAIYDVDGIGDPQIKTGRLRVTQEAEFRNVDPLEACEPTGRSECQRFFFRVRYTFTPGADKFESMTVPQRMFYTVGGGPNVTALFKDDLNLATLPHGVDAIYGNPMTTEKIARAIVGATSGDVDNLHQTNKSRVLEPLISSPLPCRANPGCPECVHIHWRWLIGADIVKALYRCRPKFDFNNGFVIVPDGSPQSVDVGILAFRDGEEHPNDYKTLFKGASLKGQQVVTWYVGSSTRSFDTFFDHGGFFVPRANDVTFGSTKVTPGAFTIKGKTMTQSVTITNTGTTPLAAPVNLALFDFSQSVTGFRAMTPDSMVGSSPLETGVTPLGNGLYATVWSDIDPLGLVGPLNPGKSVTVVLKFTVADPSKGLTYSTRVFSGFGVFGNQ